jgi:hypothetical protein
MNLNVFTGFKNPSFHPPFQPLWEKGILEFALPMDTTLPPSMLKYIASGEIEVPPSALVS